MSQQATAIPDWAEKYLANKKKLDEALGRQKTAHKNLYANWDFRFLRYSNSFL